MNSKVDNRQPLFADRATVATHPVVPTSLASAMQARVSGLKLDRRDFPLGVDNPRPRLSWRLESDRRGARQSAYRILVASSEAAILAGIGDLWDSGRVESRQSFDIEYEGRELVSRQRCWWSVQVWDEQQAACQASAPSWWEMGLLADDDWVADWLAVEGPVTREDRKAGLNWIWGEAPPEVPTHRFRFALHLPEAASGGELIAVVKQSYLWSQITRIWLDGVAIAGPGRWIAPPPAEFDAPTGTTITNLTSQRITLPALARGKHVLAVEVGTRPLSVWRFASADTPPNVPGIASLCRLELHGGGTLRLTSGARWKTNSAEHVKAWHLPDFDDEHWPSATPRTEEAHQPWPPEAAMHLRKTFPVESRLERARLYITALGAYEARLNGTKVGDELLAPGPSQYDKRVLYQAFDVSAQLRSGINVMGLTVADGWYASYDGRFAWDPPPRRVIAQLELYYLDGTTQFVTTGSDWRMHESALRSSQMKIGEVHDHRAEPIGWDTMDFDDAQWQEADVGTRPLCKLTVQSMPPIRVKERLSPIETSITPGGDLLLDFGKCIAGWCDLHVLGTEGQKIVVKYAERLDRSGAIDQTVMLQDPTGEPRHDVFILKGRPSERLAPQFVYRGFRYAQICGLKARLNLQRAEAVAIGSDLEETGAIIASEPLIESIFNLSRQSQRSCFIGIPVDNNTREVRGYNGEMAVFGEAASYLTDVSTFFPRYLENTIDAQSDDGTFPLYSPIPRFAKVMPQPPGDAPGWGDTVIFVTWQCWRQYGDTSVIRKNWTAMSRFWQFVMDHNPSYLWLNKRALDLGDWLSLEPTPMDLFATAVWAHSTALMAQMGAAIGRLDDVRRLNLARMRIQQAFNDAFVHADGTIGNGSHTSYVLPLAFALLEPARRRGAADRLAQAIRNRAPQGLTTGTWGTAWVLNALADGGHAALAHELLTSDELPSWGYMLRHGATAVWEHWDGKRGTQNQPAFGSVAGFLFTRIAGIAPASAGFATITIRPMIDPRQESGGGWYDSSMGRISTHWRQSSSGVLSLDATIPPNTSARIHLPLVRGGEIFESGRTVHGRVDLRLVARSRHEAILEVESGTYRFAVNGFHRHEATTSS